MRIWVEIGFGVTISRLVLAFIFIGVLADEFLTFRKEELENWHSLKTAYEQHPEANRKAMRTLRRRMKGVEGATTNVGHKEEV